MEHIGKKSLLVTLAFILASTLMIPLRGGSQRVAWADEINQADVAVEKQADGDSGNQDEHGTLSITSGRAHIVSTNGNTVVYSFPNLTVNCSDASKKFSSITVQFTSAIGNNDLIGFDKNHNPTVTTIDAADASAGFVEYGGNKHGNRSINNANGATAAEWQSFLRKYLTVQLANKEHSATLRMIVSPTQVTETYDFRAETGHYYKYVHVSGSSSTAQTVSWSDAYRIATNSSYMGMQGYLVTITSEAEQTFISSLISAPTWTAGTSWPTYTNVANSHPQSSGSGKPVSYYWVCGPEKGQLIASGNAASGGFNASASSRGMYAHFTGSEPNNASGIGTINGADRGEAFIHMYADGQWNDYPDVPKGGTHYVQGYIIEYGGMEGDKSPGGDGTGGSGNVDIDLDLEVNIDITLTKPDRIVTEVKDTVVGQPVVVKDTAASGEVVTIVGYDDNGLEITKPTEVKHVFKKLKAGMSGTADSDWVDIPKDELSNGLPCHAGTYKVSSDATYSKLENQDSVPYEQGSDTFTIAPKEIDVSKTASSPSNPSDPDASQSTEIEDVNGAKIEVAPRNFDKIYDGTTDWLGAKNFNISDTLANNGQAYVTFTKATYEDADSGQRNLVLEGVEIKGKDAADYVIKGISDDKKLTVQGNIAPRDLVVSTSYVVRGLSVTSWIAGVAMIDSSAVGPLAPSLFTNNAGVATDEQVKVVDGKRVWPDNLLAPGESVINVLGSDSYTAKTKGGLTLLPNNPQKGAYQLVPSFNNVTKADDGQYYTNKEVSGVEGTSTVVHNYRVIFDNAILSVEGGVPHNLTQDENGNPDPIVITKPVADPDQPGLKPIGDDDIKDIVKDHFDPDPDNPSGLIPDKGDPIITITKGGVVLDEIDPTEPGEYHIHIVYPDPAGTDTEVDIIYLIEPEDTPSETAQVYTISTKIKGAISGASITPSQNVEKGASAHVEWHASNYTYVALVEVDGKTVSNTGSFDFTQIAGNHEVVVTFADMPDLGGNTTNGFYTITVNKYGGSKGVTVSPSQVVAGGQSSQIAWQAEPGYEITSVMVDGKSVDPSTIAQGSYTFASVSSNHIVDVVFAPIDSQTKMSQTDLLVSTQIVGGPGVITGGSTVSKGESYDVAWSPVIQTTTDINDPSYAVYEVQKIEVNGIEAAGVDDTHLTLDDIKENKNIVVTMKPVVYNVSILTYGNGTASPSASFYKGQKYAAIKARPNSGSHISYIEVDGVKQFDERDGQNNASGQSALSVLSQSVTSAIDAATIPVVKADSVEDVAANEVPADVVVSDQKATSEDSEEVTFSENAASDIETQATALVTATAEAATAVYAPENTNIKAANKQTLDMDFEGIAKPHVVKVYFAEGANQINPDEIQKDGNAVTIIPSIEGGPGQITGGGVVDKDNPGTITWTLPDGYETEAIVIDGTSYPVDPDTKTIDLKDPGYSMLLDPNTDHTFTVEVVKRVPGDDALPEPRVSSNPDATDTFTVSTKLTGGPGTISATGIIKAGDPYTVTWSAGEASGVKYRVAKVLIDGVEQPNLLDVTSYTFEDLAANHTIEVILEAIPQKQDPANNSEQTDGKDKSNQDRANASSSTSKTADDAPMLPLLMMSVLAAGILVVMRKMAIKKN